MYGWDDLLLVGELVELTSFSKNSQAAVCG